MNNLIFYELAREVPPEAQKPITAGRLKNMTDINPMWRIKKLTELFGPCGIGWWYVIKDKHLAVDEQTGQVAAFVDIDLFYVYEGKTSMPIPGTGGSMFVPKETRGFYTDDECYKKALTDAISVAAKALGIGADVYWSKDRSKYSGYPENDGAPSGQGNTDGNFVPQCADCGETITIPEHEFSVKNYKRPLCRNCQNAVGSSNRPAGGAPAPSVRCERCDKEILPYISPVNGGGITPQMHAAGSVAKYKAILCLDCIAMEDARRAGGAQ